MGGEVKRALVPAWRALVILLLCVVAGELHRYNRQLASIERRLPEGIELAGVEERLDRIDRDVSDIWHLVNELEK